jgi:APA family basic amino acid/polyamine antiporter
LKLKREVGLLGAMMMGLGSIIGTGVFVSIGLGASIAGGGVLLAISLAAVVAICNGLSSAQLAANHPVSGGTYEYAHRWLTPQIGFVAGWMFLCAKSASSAAAAIGLASYLLLAVEVEPTWAYKVTIALSAVSILSYVTILGIRRSNIANSIIVSITLGSLAFFFVTGILVGPASIEKMASSPDSWSAKNLFQVTALMFVAYTGYGRIATLGEEIKEPRRNIPRAVILTLAVSMVIYLGVGFVILKFVSHSGTVASAASKDLVSLNSIASSFGFSGAGTILLIGAVTSMLGVLLNLILGLSRVMLAMGRRGEMPAVTAKITESSASPTVATLVVTAIICSIVAIGSVKSAWSFSAFTVLIYYSITNLCALRLKREERLYSVIPAWIGLFACLFLAFWVDVEIWCAGLVLILAGLIWQWTAQKLNNK